MSAACATDRFDLRFQSDEKPAFMRHSFHCAGTLLHATDRPMHIAVLLNLYRALFSIPTIC